MIESTVDARGDATTARRWQPVLAGTPAARAMAVVDEIARAIAPLLLDERAGADLANGASGGALLFRELEQIGRRGPRSPTARGLVDEAWSRCRRLPLSGSLWSGTTGVAYAAAQVAARPPSPVLIAQLTDAVRRLPSGEYDLIAGAIGGGVLALELLPDSRAAELLEAVVAHLAATAQRRDGGLAWATSHPTIPASWRYDLGVAHGVPGVVALLAGALASPSPPRGTAELLTGAVRWTLAQRLSGAARSCFPRGVGGPAPGPARLAWCYGDAGIAVALLLAARALADDRLHRVAHDVARKAATRSFESSGVVDAGVCHGAAGVAHMFGRMLQFTADESCAAAARYWLDRTLALRRLALPAGRTAGTTAVDGDGPAGPRPDAEPGLLVGGAGVGLVLLAACSEQDPRWDRALLASHPFL
ncbi:MAG: lantibiotic biosynthesis protein [Solirubrobacteraceae bacterium]|nr:lantibiotic biosynthesis protein [Solirubrobacteraceae bacterium]